MIVERKCISDGVLINWNNTKMLVKMLLKGITINKYSATLIDGSWPNKNDLISLCCGDNPSTPFHFGGNVFINENIASVDVYLD